MRFGKIILWCLAFVALGCTPDKPAPPPPVVTEPEPVVTVPEPVVPPLDTALDQVARYVAGLPQAHSGPYSALEQEPGWQTFKAEMDSGWAKMNRSRLDSMRAWRVREVAPKLKDSLWLFYPFSGPDFLHAHVLFPDAQGYIMAALEPVTQVPDLLSLEQKQRGMFLDTLGNSLRDVMSKSFFLTLNMRKHFRYIRGVLPVFFFFLTRTGHEMMGLDFLVLDSVGRETLVPFRELAGRSTQGFRLAFRPAGGGKTRDLYYFSTDISDRGMATKQSGLESFVQSRRPHNTFLKSASYLMHNDWFSNIRSLIVSGSAALVQDDTGIPYTFLKRQYNGWMYGQYVRPVRPFHERDKQPDLDSAFRTSAKPLPFSLGYHWTTKQQNYMLFTRRK